MTDLEYTPIVDRAPSWAKALEVIEAARAVNKAFALGALLYRPDEILDRLSLALEAFDAVAQPEPRKPKKVEVKFVGGPWAGYTTEVEQVVGPVFAVGYESVGNHYWLESQSEGTPLYYWDGTPLYYWE